jgi:hypothetical protein
VTGGALINATLPLDVSYSSPWSDPWRNGYWSARKTDMYQRPVTIRAQSLKKQG